ncbi:carbon storage regulator CsrA [Caloranaerobacter ferrireducens]|uniref:carbon storage regulator CsrA n=1 Tax=Caloranaerobacter ferrireducens TaxID=1323370 RepID=UPI00084DFBB7|nr:carbon storage regulator CsrA [Caloranaerobacter ferrireducens]
MLVLTRKKNESIVINGDIEIVVVGIEDGKVKLGIKAPKNVEIHRKEIYEAIQKENKKAANTPNIDFRALKKILKNN